VDCAGWYAHQRVKEEETGGQVHVCRHAGRPGRRKDETIQANRADESATRARQRDPRLHLTTHHPVRAWRNQTPESGYVAPLRRLPRLCTSSVFLCTCGRERVRAVQAYLPIVIHPRPAPATRARDESAAPPGKDPKIHPSRAPDPVARIYDSLLYCTVLMRACLSDLTANQSAELDLEVEERRKLGPWTAQGGDASA
jgi:hypothetical protein